MYFKFNQNRPFGESCTLSENEAKSSYIAFRFIAQFCYVLNDLSFCLIHEALRLLDPEIFLVKNDISSLCDGNVSIILCLVI